jgi:antitoxin component of RelBE/YafQ-DinJ toxin-antitoxin module
MRKPKKRLTILVDKESINHFISMGEQVDMPYHTLINMYLTKCAREGYRLPRFFKPPSGGFFIYSN